MNVRLAYLLLSIYIAISLAYQAASSVSLIIGYFDLRHQVREPFTVDFERPAITSVTEEAKKAGLKVGDTLESINGLSYTGPAQWQNTRWKAHAGDILRLVVRQSNLIRKVSLRLIGYSSGRLANAAAEEVNQGEGAFLIFLHIIVPLFCLALGYWVALARPTDPNALLILVLLSYPEAFISVATFNFLPGAWLSLRLFWHVILDVLAPLALLWLAVLFPERSQLDLRLPWFKWLVTSVLLLGLGMGLFLDYAGWYNLALVPNLPALDQLNDRLLNWTIVLCLIVYWVAIFGKLRETLEPDPRRRLRVLCAGSIVGLGSLLIIWGLLPRFGIADPSNIRWLAYLSALLMIVFPLSLAYVVIVQRAMDVRILLRIGTQYALARTTLAAVQIAAAILIFYLFIIPVIEGYRRGTFSLIFSALAIAGLVGLFLTRATLSSRLQRWLDRKFFREVYNSELILSDLVRQARTLTEPLALIDTVTRRISEVLHVPQVAVLLRSGEVFQLQQALGTSLNGITPLAVTSRTIRQLVGVDGPTFVRAGRQRPEWLDEVGEPERYLLKQTGAELLLPLPGRDRLLGIMTLGPKQSEEAYSPSDLRLLSSVATQTGLGLDIADLARDLANEVTQRALISREIEIAREVQERLFPQSMPVVRGASLAGLCRPAQGIGGDYYDAIELEDGRLALAVGDVSGKGIPAALLMASLRACLRTSILDGARDLAGLMQKLNQLVYESSSANRYATFFFSVYEPATRVLSFVNAGHNPPFLLRAGVSDPGASIRLEAGGSVIGLLPNLRYKEMSLVLDAGDVLLAYTDGISEAMTADDEEWGEESMLEAVQVVRHEPPETIIRTVLESADRFTHAAPQHDDMTLLVLKVM